MKKALFLFFIIFLITTFQSSAENVLVITNPKSGESDVLKKGSFLVFELKADKSMHNGLIRTINDSSLEFDDGQVSFSQINILGGVARSRIAAGHVANAIGNVLIVAGSAT